MSNNHEACSYCNREDWHSLSNGFCNFCIKEFEKNFSQLFDKDALPIIFYFGSCFILNTPYLIDYRRFPYQCFKIVPNWDFRIFTTDHLYNPCNPTSSLSVIESELVPKEIKKIILFNLNDFIR